MSSSSDLSQARYAAMRWNTPLGEEHAVLLLERLDVFPGAVVVDLGCGWGTLLIRAVEAGGPGTTGTGVDLDDQVLRTGRNTATDRGLNERVKFVHGDAASWTDPADRFLCIGASQAWSNVGVSLAALAKLVPPGGRLLFGEAYWQQAPTVSAQEMFGNAVLSLPNVVREAVSAGFLVLHLSTADQREWDDFEATWRRGRHEWLLANPQRPNATEVRAVLDRQLMEYLEVYRGILGFCYLVLGR